MKESYLTAGIKLDQLFRLIGRNKLTYNFSTIVRLGFLVQSSLWSSFFSWIETARYSRKLKNYPVPDDPIFIIGHWRTGSTFLHQLMNLDPNLSAPTLFQVAVPDSFLVSYPYYRPIFKRVVSRHRPMDMVKIGMDEPQEDEYAIYRLTDFSPLENLIFPKSKAYFLNHGSHFLPTGEQLEKWKVKVKDFYKKLHYRSGKRIVSKNPFNSFRIKTLYEIFPNARFIHIVRHPYSVVPSTIHMWNIVGKQNAMHINNSSPGFESVVSVLKNLLETVETDCLALPPGTMGQIRFEDLEASPAEVLKAVYGKLGIPFTGLFESRIHEFMMENSSYKKNHFTLTSKEKSIIAYELGVHMQSCHYGETD